MMIKPKYAWKILKTGMKSESGDLTWKKDRWVTHDGPVSICLSGLHGSKRLIDAMQYVTPGVCCLVEYDDVVEEQDNKFVCRRMKVVKTYRFTKKMEVALAIYSAELCIKNFEDNYPDDKRPREAIRAAKRWLKNPSKKNQSATRSVWSAARSAAGKATWSATLDKIEAKLMKIIGHTKVVP